MSRGSIVHQLLLSSVRHCDADETCSDQNRAAPTQARVPSFLPDLSYVLQLAHRFGVVRI